MYSEEETELRDLILQNLESCGFLNKIKAELRAGVCLALEEDGNLRNKIPIFNKKFDDFAGTREGKLLLSLVREFLEHFNLKFTLSVFDPETAMTSPCISRAELCEQLKLNSNIVGPILSEFVKIETDADMNENSITIPPDELQTVTNNSLKSSIVESASEKNIYDILNENNALNKKAFDDINLEKEKFVTKSIDNDMKKASSSAVILHQTETTVLTDISSETHIADIVPITGNKLKDEIFKEKNDVLSSDHDPFFDEPLPSEKPSFFSFPETFKDKTESNLTGSTINELNESKKRSLSSLRDLPSISNNEWTFSRDPKNTLPSLDSQKSVSSSEASNEDIINLDSRDSFQKKDSPVESNEESSEKQISEESIEEDIEEDFSAGLEDLLNSSLSLADDATTDQTVSQVSVVEGIDHVEPCK